MKCDKVKLVYKRFQNKFVTLQLLSSYQLAPYHIFG